jgi:serine/threonine-protein kinase
VKLFNFLRFGGRKRYGGYELIEKVARGGMSEIWKGRDPENGEVVAIKILTPETVGMMDKFAEIFDAEEGAIALRLNHPNVIRTIDYGRHGKDEYYIVMEYVPGPNLQALTAVGSPRVQNNRFPLVMQMGTGLRYIHEQGLVHRDFCPKNVLYGPDNVAKIIDFGLTIPVVAKRRTTMVRAGTASYMAPEQVRSQVVDERADIYAYGVSAFEVLTGRRPFPHAGDRKRRMQDQLNIQPMPLRQMEPEMPQELEQVIDRCTEKDPEKRYRYMDDVMRDMRAAVEVALSKGL